ncbi:hypothetical protein F511_33821 [Dorcoceras hygrometricum]|uniref:Uncharacterized protein n=1 Tax=Dorcoceras hygrometricum TaxID=472368 RepID=A0A2Z7B3X8_9LAMI|nr:hypothetical protein F511_33821 [Dorcoceras hygrometricum]
MSQEESREATSAVPIDEEISAEEQSAVEVAAATGVQEPAVEHVDEQVAETTADEETTVKDVEMIDESVSLPAEAAVVNKDVYTADDVDVIIEQVLAETVHIGADEEEQAVDTFDVGDKTAETTDGEKHCDTDEEMESIDVGTDFGDQQLQTDVAADSRTDAAADLFVEESVDDMEVTADEQSVGERTDADEAMSLEDIILSIPVDVPLPAACVEITKITLGKDIKIPGVDERTWYLASLPQIPVDDKGKDPLLVKDPIKFKKLPTIKVEDISEKEDQVLYYGETDSTRVALNRKVYILLKYRELLVRKFLESWKLNFVPGVGTSATDLKVIDMLSDLHLFLLEELKQQTLAHDLRWDRACCSQPFEDKDDGAKLKETLLLHLHDIEKRFTVRFEEQDRVLGVLHKDSHNQKHLLSLDIKSSQKQLSAQAATAAIDVVDVRREVKELNAKVTYLDGQVAATRNDLLEFRANAQESLNHITDQLSELVNYINRGGKDKKGEDNSSRGPQPPPDDQGRCSGNTGGDNVRTTDIVDRFSGSMSREGQGRGRGGERRSSGNRSGHLKRRRMIVVDLSECRLKIG